MSWKIAPLLIFLLFMLMVRLGSATFKDLVSKNPDHVRFFMYDPHNKEFWQGYEVTIGDVRGMLRSKMRAHYPTKILIHGFVHNYTCWFPQEIKDAYLERGFNYNIIVVDWGPLSTPHGMIPFSSVGYPQTMHNVPIVGYKLAAFISFLRDVFNLDLHSIHLIGFSLGAHIAGVAGEAVFWRYGRKLGRITGLDPAGPFFVSGNLGRRLRRTDANFVDVVHTNCMFYGSFGTLGHLDFYVNGGIHPQPGCGFSASCSHSSASMYFKQSIGRPLIPACQCDPVKYYLNVGCRCTSMTVFGDPARPGPYFGKFFVNMPRGRMTGKYVC